MAAFNRLLYWPGNQRLCRGVQLKMTDENVLRILIMNTMGDSILIETFKSAVIFFVSSSNHIQKQDKEGQLAYSFIQGSGLDLLVNRFQLSYDSYSLRTLFNYKV